MWWLGKYPRGEQAIPPWRAVTDSGRIVSGYLHFSSSGDLYQHIGMIIMRRFPATKKQARLEARYRKALKASGFRSYVSANRRRSDLIQKEIYGGGVTPEEDAERAMLDKVTDYYCDWKTNDDLRLSIRRLDRMAKRLGIDLSK